MNELRRLNATIVKDVTCPTLCPSAVMDKWTKGDDAPVYVIEKISFPVTANNCIYEGAFFEKLLDKIKERPIPGSKSGHESDTLRRPPTDLILVGGKVEKNSDGTGSVYLKNFIPRVGESGSNEVLRREAESGMLQFSLVSYCTEVTRDNKTYIIEPLFGLRNDVVELPAMQQTITLAAASEGATVDDGSRVKVWHDVYGEISLAAARALELEEQRRPAVNSAVADY